MALFEIPFMQSGKIVAFALLILNFVITIYYLTGERRPYIRRVPALDAIEEAVGRATEMGKPVVCSYGWAFGMFDYWTIAGLSILSHVARLCARNDTRLIVPTGGSTGSFVVRPVAVEIVRAAYMAEGKEDQFNENDIPFLSGEQFAMGTGYAGILISERPATMIFTGSAGADAMMVAEVSNQVGAITITSASYMSNVACLACASDYIMIAEESVAAGAYLSRDPAQLASIRTQDIYKGIAICLTILSWILLQVGNNFLVELLST